MTLKEYQEFPDEVHALVEALRQIQMWMPRCVCPPECTHISNSDPACSYHSEHLAEIDLIASLALINFFGE